MSHEGGHEGGLWLGTDLFLDPDAEFVELNTYTLSCMCITLPLYYNRKEEMGKNKELRSMYITNGNLNAALATR